MKKLVLALAVGSLLSACSSTTDRYQHQAEVAQKQREIAAQTALKQSPKWFVNQIGRAHV